MIQVTAKEKILYPRQSTEGSAGFDVFCSCRIEILPGEVELIPLGIKLKMNRGECCLVMSRSSMPLKKGCLIPNGVGLIDSDYRGELHLEVYNFSNEIVKFMKGEKCGQLVFIKHMQDIVTMPIELYNNREELYKSERGEGGFGSTGN